MSGQRIQLGLTPAQLRTVNAALALFEAEVETDNMHEIRLDLVERTRTIVHRCLTENGIEP